MYVRREGGSTPLGVRLGNRSVVLLCSSSQLLALEMGAAQNPLWALNLSFESEAGWHGVPACRGLAVHQPAAASNQSSDKAVCSTRLFVSTVSNRLLTLPSVCDGVVDLNLITFPWGWVSSPLSAPLLLHELVLLHVLALRQAAEQRPFGAVLAINASSGALAWIWNNSLPSGPALSANWTGWAVEQPVRAARAALAARPIEADQERGVVFVATLVLPAALAPPNTLPACSLIALRKDDGSKLWELTDEVDFTRRAFRVPSPPKLARLADGTSVIIWVVQQGKTGIISATNGKVLRWIDYLPFNESARAELAATCSIMVKDAIDFDLVVLKSSASLVAIGGTDAYLFFSRLATKTAWINSSASVTPPPWCKVYQPLPGHPQAQCSADLLAATATDNQKTNFRGEETDKLI
eukprot:g71481.t1